MSNNNYNNSDMNFPIEGIPGNAVFIVKSVADEECALASLLESQANLLCNAIDPCITVCDFNDIIQSIIQTMKTIVQKNNILEVKLRETLNFIQREGIECLDYNQQFELLNNLNSVLESIGTEEFSIGYLIDELGNGVANISYCTFNDIKVVNNLVITLMKLIVEKNMILQRKLRTVIKLIKFIKCSDFDIFIKVKKELLCTIKNCLINSIYKEEKGLAKLIYGESAKVSDALKMCIKDEEITELDSLINNVIDVIYDKKRILEYKLSETLTLLNTVGFSSCEIDSITDHIKELQTLAFAAEFELARLIKDKSKALNDIIDKECCNYHELINFNNCITCILVSVLLNLTIGRKNKNSYECDPYTCNKKSICKKFNNLIKLIDSK